MWHSRCLLREAVGATKLELPRFRPLHVHIFTCDVKVGVPVPKVRECHQDACQVDLPNGRDDFTKKSLKVLKRNLLHFPCRRAVQAHECPEDVWVGADTVVKPLRRTSLARWLPLTTQLPQSVCTRITGNQDSRPSAS